MMAMKKFEWSQTPISREKKIQNGEWVDVTHNFLGRVASNGNFSICCSFDFYTRVLKGNLSAEKVQLMNKHLLNDIPFEMKIGKEVFRCQCIKTIEEFKGKKTVCFTFFEGGK